MAETYTGIVKSPMRHPHVIREWREDGDGRKIQGCGEAISMGPFMNCLFIWTIPDN